MICVDETRPQFAAIFLAYKGIVNVKEAVQAEQGSFDVGDVFTNSSESAGTDCCCAVLTSRSHSLPQHRPLFSGDVRLVFYIEVRSLTLYCSRSSAESAHSILFFEVRFLRES